LETFRFRRIIFVDTLPIQKFNHINRIEQLFSKFRTAVGQEERYGTATQPPRSSPRVFLSFIICCGLSRARHSGPIDLFDIIDAHDFAAMAGNSARQPEENESQTNLIYRARTSKSWWNVGV
jgi:hypothetical protein